ncbi:hypothetical protein D3C81_1869160 [compost metagenome]
MVRLLPLVRLLPWLTVCSWVWRVLDFCPPSETATPTNCPAFSEVMPPFCCAACQAWTPVRPALIPCRAESRLSSSWLACLTVW